VPDTSSLESAERAQRCRKQEYLDRRILFSRDRLAPNSPVTEEHVNDGMTLDWDLRNCK
jgi:hypothetical protein